MGTRGILTAPSLYTRMDKNRSERERTGGSGRGREGDGEVREGGVASRLESGGERQGVRGRGTWTNEDLKRYVIIR